MKKHNVIGDQILEIRKSRNWSMKRLADELGVTRGAVNNYEKGIIKPKPAIMEKLILLSDNPNRTVADFVRGATIKEAYRFYFKMLLDDKELNFEQILDKLSNSSINPTFFDVLINGDDKNVSVYDFPSPDSFIIGLKIRAGEEIVQEIKRIDEKVITSKTFINFCIEKGLPIPRFDFEDDVYYRSKLLPKIIEEYKLK